MTVAEILRPVIVQELKKYEQSGTKIKLKSILTRRIHYSVICGIIALLGFAYPVFFFVIPIYVILMLKTRDAVGVILSIAKKNPDKPIQQIVADEINA